MNPQKIKEFCQNQIDVLEQLERRYARQRKYVEADKCVESAGCYGAVLAFIEEEFELNQTGSSQKQF